MKFGVVFCRKCHRAIGLELRHKSTTCPFCNMKLKIILSDIRYSTASEKDLAIKISKINQQLEEHPGDTAFKPGVVKSEWEIDGLDKELEISNGNEKNKKQDIDQKQVERSVYENLDPIKRIAIKFKNESESISLIKDLMLALSHELGEVTLEDFQKLLIECNIEENKVEDYIEKLKNLGIIYEPKAGIYKLIEEN